LFPDLIYFDLVFYIVRIEEIPYISLRKL